MGRRLEFQEVLQSLIGIRPDGKKNVYFQPPSSVKMNYPCIVYSLSRISVKKANNKLYGFIKGLHGDRYRPRSRWHTQR